MLESFQGSSLPASFTCLAQVLRARRLSGRLFGKALNRRMRPGHADGAEGYFCFAPCLRASVVRGSA
jgi:hypothetical protein